MNVDTGKMAWYYSTSPHDMHDYDSAQTPVLVDAMFNGKMRKLVLTAARNGYYFTLDRVTGEHLVTSKYGLDTNWANGLNQMRRADHDPGKNATVAGSLVSPTSDGTTNWEPPTYSPDTGLFYVAQNNGYSIFYLTDVDPRGSMGLGGKEEAAGRVGRQLPDGHRLQDGQGCVETSLLRRRRRRWIVDHRRETAVCGRWRGQPGGARCRYRETAVEHAHRRCHQCAADLHAGWPPVSDRGDWRYGVVFHAVLIVISGRRSDRRWVAVRDPRWREGRVLP